MNQNGCSRSPEYAAGVENSVLQVFGVPLVMQEIMPGKYDGLLITVLYARERIALAKKRTEQ